MKRLHRTIPLVGAVMISSGALVACASDSSSTSPVPDATSASTLQPPSTSPSPATSQPPLTGSTSVLAAAVIDPGDGGVYEPAIDPTNFTDVIDNPYLPMPVGARWLFEGESDGEVETVEITVTSERKDIMGVSTFVVRDTVMISGQLVEDTFDWFAQDADGNVWYFGEDVKNYEAGKLADTKGSWTAGVDGAMPGIVMAAEPVVGDPYRQEFLMGEAEDLMQYVDIGTALTVRAGTFDDVVTTHDWTPLEPDTVEEKAYARGVGKIREEKIAGGNGFAELVEFDVP